MPSNPVATLVRRVALRLHLIALAGRVYGVVLFAAAAYALVLVASKLLGLIPDPGWWALAAAPAVGLAVGLFLYRRPTAGDAAHIIDRRMQTKDLFLTAMLIDGAPGSPGIPGASGAPGTPGEYAPLVVTEAHRIAPTVRPRTVAPYHWESRFGRLVLVLGLLAIGAWLPIQLDPFGFNQERERETERAKQLAQMQKATEARKAVLAVANPVDKQAEQVRSAVDELKQAFNQMKKQDKAGNFNRLKMQQAQIGQMWKQAKEKSLENAMRQSTFQQRFGAMQTPEARKWQEDLKKGDVSDLKKELDDIKEKARQLAQETDPQKKQQLQEQMRQQMQQVAEAMQQAGSQPCNDAMARAMAQMGMAGMQGMSDEALKAMAESLELTQAELESLAQTMQNAQSMEDAMKALQQAMQLNDMDPLDGGQCGGCNSLAEYEALYKKLIGQCQGNGVGPFAEGDPNQGGKGGMGGPGHGQGGIAPESEDQTGQFQDAKSASKLQPGKTLLDWKTRELSDPGQIKAEYAQSLVEIKRAASEAVLSDDVPPGERDVVKAYFDNIEQTLPGASTSSGAATSASTDTSTSNDPSGSDSE